MNERSKLPPVWVLKELRRELTTLRDYAAMPEIPGEARLAAVKMWLDDAIENIEAALTGWTLAEMLARQRRLLAEAMRPEEANRYTEAEGAMIHPATVGLFQSRSSLCCCRTRKRTMMGVFIARHWR